MVSKKKSSKKTKSKKTTSKKSKSMKKKSKKTTSKKSKSMKKKSPKTTKSKTKSKLKRKTKTTRKKTSKSVHPMMKPQEFKIESEKPQISSERPSTVFAALAYVVQFFNIIILGSGAVFSILIYLVSYRRFTKFHALQSFFLGFVFSLLSFILSDSIALGNPVVDVITYPSFYMMIGVLVVVSFILLAFKAYKHDWFELPLFGDLANRYS